MEFLLGAAGVLGAATGRYGFNRSLKHRLWPGEHADRITSVEADEDTAAAGAAEAGALSHSSGPVYMQQFGTFLDVEQAMNDQEFMKHNMDPDANQKSAGPPVYTRRASMDKHDKATREPFTFDDTIGQNTTPEVRSYDREAYESMVHRTANDTNKADGLFDNGMAVFDDGMAQMRRDHDRHKPRIANPYPVHKEDQSSPFLGIPNQMLRTSEDRGGVPSAGLDDGRARTDMPAFDVHSKSNRSSHGYPLPAIGNENVTHVTETGQATRLRRTLYDSSHVATASQGTVNNTRTNYATPGSLAATHVGRRGSPEAAMWLGGAFSGILHASERAGPSIDRAARLDARETAVMNRDPTGDHQDTHARMTDAFVETRHALRNKDAGVVGNSASLNTGKRMGGTNEPTRLDKNQSKPNVVNDREFDVLKANKLFSAFL